jgi:hypothetical protein
MSHPSKIVDPISFKVELILKANLDKRINLRCGNKEYVIDHKDVLKVEREVAFSDYEDKIRLIEFSGFQPNPRPQIRIKEVKINGYQVRDFRSLFSFTMANNLFVENKLILDSDVMAFNGHLDLDTKRNRDRLLWFPTTYSKDRTSVVNMNSTLNCQSGYGCFQGLDCRHDPEWQRYQLRDGPYDCIALGCSFTAGTGIRTSGCWPALIGDNVLNLGVPGIGCDSMLVNLRCLLDKKIRFRKIILLFPKMSRRLYRIRRKGHYFNIPLKPNHQNTDEGKFNIFFSKDQLDKTIDEKMKHMITYHDPRRDQKVIERIIKILKNTDNEFYMSSWCEETYQFLKSLPIQEHLLPMFNEDGDASTGRDGSHPAEQIHRKWVESIKHQIGS